MNKKIDIKFYYDDPISVDLIEATFKKSFSRDFDRKYWDWRFLKKPRNSKTYINYIIENNELAAYYAITPEIIYIDQKPHKIALSNMTMTHPDYQGKGYFKLLANAMYDELKKDNFIAVYGFANSNSHYGFRKYLNWKDLSILNIFKLKKEDFRGFLIKKSTSLKISILENIDFTTCELNNILKKKTHISRDKEDLNWRLKENPNNTYQILEAKTNTVSMKIIFKSYKNEIDIIEVFDNCADSSEYELFLTNSIHYLMETVAETINLWSNLHDLEHLFLEKIGFKEDAFNTYFGIIPLKNVNKLDNIKNWHYRFYDSDIF